MFKQLSFMFSATFEIEKRKRKNMSSDSEIEYKNLTFNYNEQFSYLELVIDEINFSNQENYISSVSQLLEFALTIHPRFIILNRENHKFTIASKLFTFTANNIIHPLKLDSIKNIICIGSKEEYEARYKEIEKIEPFIKWAESKQAAVEWIKNNMGENPDS